MRSSRCRMADLSEVATRVGWWARWARLLRRVVWIPPHWAAGVVVFAAATILVTSSGLVSSASLSPIQSAEASMGSFGYKAQLQGELLAGQSPRRHVEQALISAGASRATLIVTYHPGFTQVARRFTPVQEANWAEQPLGATYQLDSGRWPMTASEGVVSTAVPGIAIGEVLSTSDGRLKLTVVGKARNIYSFSADFVLAAPGTWHSIPRGTDSADPLTASEELLWDTDDEDRVIAALLEATKGSDPGDGSLDDTTVVPTTRETIRNRFETGIIDDPLTGGLPALLIPLSAGIVAGLVAARGHVRMRRQLHSLGIPRLRVASTLTMAALCSVVVGAIAGVGTGLLLTLAGRPVLVNTLNQVLSPLRFPWPVWLRLVLLSAGATAVVLGLSALSRLRRPPWLALARQSTAAAILVYAVVSLPAATGDDSFAVGVALLIAGVTLLAPDVATLLLRLGGRAAPLRLSRRLHDHGRGVGGLAMALTALLGIVSGGAVASSSSLASMNTKQVSTIPPGYLALLPLTTEQPPVSVQRKLEVYLEISNPIAVRVMTEYSSPDGSLAMVPTVAEIERLMGIELSDTQRQQLNSGKALTKDGTQLTLDDGKTLPSVAHAWDVALPYRALITESTAKQQGFVTDGYMTLIYPRLPDGVIARASSAADALGFSRDYLDMYRTPDQFTTPVTVAVTLLSSAIVCAAIIISFVAATISALRTHLAIAHALGLPPAWPRAVVIHQVAATVGAACLLTLVSISSLAFIFGNLMPFEVVVPWDAVAMVLCVALLGAITGIAYGQWRLTAAEREISGAPGA